MSARFTSHGHDILTSAEMSPWQRERMGAGFPAARRTAGSIFPRVAILIGVAALVSMIWRIFA